jgi:F-type H+-transporting ATPase subunit gamma
MANLLDLRRRIKSVKNTQQITKAMKMVSAARLKRAQNNVTAARPFANKMTDVLTELASRAGDDFSHPLLDARGNERILILLISPDRGLCGALNTNLVKGAQAFIRKRGSKHMEMIAVGRKGRDAFRRRNVNIIVEHVGLTGKGRIEYAEAADIAREIINRFTEDETLDRVYLIYNEFRSVLQQRVAAEQLLPISRVEESGETSGAAQTETSVDYIYEQSPAEIFARLLPRFVETQIFRALLESIASEQGARMTAMDAASKNAGELIGSLTLNMNRIRQAAITTEIIEVVSGSAAAQG